MTHLQTAVLAQVRAGRRTASSIVVTLRETPNPLHTDIETVREALASLHESGELCREVRRNGKHEVVIYRPADEPIMPPRRGPPLKPFAEHVRRVLVSLHQGDLDALDAYAAKIGVTRSRAIALLAARV